MWGRERCYSIALGNQEWHADTSTHTTQHNNYCIYFPATQGKHEIKYNSFRNINAMVSSCSASQNLKRQKNMDITMHVGPELELQATKKEVVSDKNLEV